MVNSKKKGSRGELYFVNILKTIFPKIHRNWHQQCFSKSNGCDLVDETGIFNWESKIGKQLPEWNEKVLKQVQEEGKKENWNVVLCKKDRCKPYVMIPFEDFLDILESMKYEGLL